MDFILHNLGKIFLAFIGVILVVLAIKNHAKIKAFLLEVKQELSKVSWSTRQELMGATVVVIVVTSIMAVYIGIVDLGLSKVLSIIFK
jgi:preprotein translocase SecE subunit